MNEYKIDTGRTLRVELPNMPTPYGWEGNPNEDTWKMHQGTIKEVIYRLKSRGYFDDAFLERNNLLHKKEDVIQELKDSGLNVKYSKEHNGWVHEFVSKRAQLVNYIKENQPISFEKLCDAGFTPKMISRVYYEGRVKRDNGIYTV